MTAVRAPSPLGTGLVELLRDRSARSTRLPYLVHARSGRAVSYAEAGAGPGRWSGLLDDLEVAPGATVGLAVADPVDFALVFLGVIAAGRTAAPLDPGATDAELAAVCDRVGPSIVVADRQAPGGARRGRPEWVTMPAGTFDLAESAAAARAMCSPMPLDAPVTRALRYACRTVTLLSARHQAPQRGGRSGVLLGVADQVLR